VIQSLEVEDMRSVVAADFAEGISTFIQVVSDFQFYLLSIRGSCGKVQFKIGYHHVKFTLNLIGEYGQRIFEKLIGLLEMKLIVLYNGFADDLVVFEYGKIIRTHLQFILLLYFLQCF